MRGRRRSKARELLEPRDTATREFLHDSGDEADQAEVVKGFFACYLLCSLSPRHKSHTYIGFTVNPQRRIKQHNGEKRCGAWRTKRARPWEMVLCIYGFPSNISALQFEWAWQHPKESLAVRKTASSFKSLSGMANKIKLAFSMLTLPSWESLNLTVNFFSTKYMKHVAGCPKLPNQMKVNVCSMDDLPCYDNNFDVEEEDDDDDDDDDGEGDVNVAVEGMNGNTDQLGRSSFQFWEEVLHYNSETWKSGEEDHRSLSGSSRPPPELREQECTRASTSLTPSSCSTDQSTPRNSENKTMVVSPELDVINLCTPSSGIIRSKTKRALFDSDIIDLTDSPVVIHL